MDYTVAVVLGLFPTLGHKKTYDLKSAYRQVPIREDHLQFSFFSIFNVEEGGAETYQLLTLLSGLPTVFTVF